MNEFLGKRISINSSLRDIHSCSRCGGDLNKKDYNARHEICGICRYEFGYSKDEFADNGINNVDKILAYKLGRM